MKLNDKCKYYLILLNCVLMVLNIVFKNIIKIGLFFLVLYKYLNKKIRKIYILKNINVWKIDGLYLKY